MSNQTILITGGGGYIAQSIAQIIRQLFPEFKLVGTDIHSRHPGKVFYDEVALVPRADDATYIDVLSDLIDRHKVTIIIPTTEDEIKVLNDRDDNKVIQSALILMANKLAIDISLDKLKTMTFLKEKNVTVPWTIDAATGSPVGFPCIFKQRSVHGSRELRLIDNEADVDAVPARLTAKGIWQDRLLPSNAEYTCSVYRTANNEVRTLIMERTLEDGFTVQGTLDDNQDIRAYLESIATAIDLKGSINVQLILTDDGPVLFEINPRFSSTVGFRHLLGFPDFEWQLRELMGETLAPFVDIDPEGIEFFRVSKCIVFKKSDLITF